MKILSFELTMPNVGSWNGKWSGTDRKYYVIRKVSDSFLEKQEYFKELKDKERVNWYYSWNDGWGANVRLEIVDSKESAKRLKISKGFCGYDWMIDSILSTGIITTSAVSSTCV